MSIPKFSRKRSAAIRDGLIAEVEGAAEGEPASRSRPAKRRWVNLGVFALSGALVGGAVSGAAWASQGVGSDAGSTAGPAAPHVQVGDVENTGVPAPAGVTPGAPIVSLLPGGETVTVLSATSIPLEPPAGATHLRVEVTFLSAGHVYWGFDSAGNNPNGGARPEDIGTPSAWASYDFPLGDERILYVTLERGATVMVVYQFLDLIETAWGVNALGETFGVSKEDGRTPDLIAVALPGGDGDDFGYSRTSDLEGPQPANPETAATWAPQPREVPIFESDGVTQIGLFPVG